MNEVVKQKFIKALTRDGYKQTRTHLRSKDGFCGMGVLCDLYLKEHSLSWTGPNSMGRYSALGSTTVPAKEVLVWAGIPQRLAGFYTDMNDSGKTFAEIAEHLSIPKVLGS